MPLKSGGSKWNQCLHMSPCDCEAHVLPCKYGRFVCTFVAKSFKKLLKRSGGFFLVLILIWRPTFAFKAYMERIVDVTLIFMVFAQLSVLGQDHWVGCSAVTLLKTKKKDPLFLRTKPSPWSQNWRPFSNLISGSGRISTWQLLERSSLLGLRKISNIFNFFLLGIFFRSF